MIMDVVGSDRHLRADLGPRIELVTADRYCRDITIALYRASNRPATGILHSYSLRPCTNERLDSLTRAMASLGGLTADVPEHAITFRCGTWHELALRRVFLDAAKLDPADPPSPRLLEADDTRRGVHVTVQSLGAGRYAVEAGSSAGRSREVTASVAAGLEKLAEARLEAGDGATVAFACMADHDALVAALLPRAINVRAVLREQESAAQRGLLVAPSAQSQEAET